MGDVFKRGGSDPLGNVGGDGTFLKRLGMVGDVFKRGGSDPLGNYDSLNPGVHIY